MMSEPTVSQSTFQDRTEKTVDQQWSDFAPIVTGDDYVKSIRERGTTLFLFGENVDEPADHPIIKPSINALKKTYDLAVEDPELATAYSPYISARVNRFLHVPKSPEDLVQKHKMQRRLGQLTGTCFQRCTGMDTLSVLHSITFEVDQKYNTQYHHRFIEFLKKAQKNNVLISAGMTDPKGDRSKRPHQQADPDMFMRVVERNDQGVYVTGVKAHMTGGWNQHWICVMPTMNMLPEDKEYAIVGMIPVQAEGITYIYGRQSSDMRAMGGGNIDQGNANYGGQEVLVFFDRVFIPHEHVFLDGEYEFAQELVTRFTAYHRASYVCKTGLGDVITGAAASIADFNGIEKVSHIKDKLVEMVHLNETIYSSGIASAHEAKELSSGAYMNDVMLANVCKHNVTRFPYELSRIAQDIAGGIMVTMPSEADFKSEEVGQIVDRFLRGRDDIPTEDRMRILRLIENMTLGRNAVGYLTESMHGAGSPQAQRIQILREMNVEEKKKFAQDLAGIKSKEE